MTTPPRRPAAAAGGFPLAAGVLLGAIIGFAAGQPTIGLFVGAALGIAASLFLWLRDRH